MVTWIFFSNLPFNVFVKIKHCKNKIRNETKEETLQLRTEIQRIIRDYELWCELHANQLNSLEKMDKFLETYNLSI